MAKHKAKTFEAKRKKQNLYKNKGEKGGEQVKENWFLSEVDSDTQSIGGDSLSSFGNSNNGGFKSMNALRKKLGTESDKVKNEGDE